MKPTKAPVSRRALVQRINRKYAKDRITLKKTTGRQAKIEVGQYFLLDLERGSVVEKHVDLVQFALKHGFLADWERLED